MIFSITAQTPRPEFGSIVQAQFPDQTYEVFQGPPQTWLVYAPGQTTQQVLTKLGSGNGEDGRIIVTGVSGYFGWHVRDLWEWIESRGKS